MLLAYIFVLPMRRVEWMPLLSVLGTKFQLTEVVFLVLAPLLLYRARWQLRAGGTPFLYAALAYVAVLTVSTVMAGEYGGYAELAGRYYLLLVFLFFLWAIRREGISFLISGMRAWRYGAVLLALTAYLGYLLALLGWVTPFVWVYEDYPYFGTVFRAMGAARGSNAMIFLLLPPLFHDYYRWRCDRKKPWFLLSVLPLMVLTLSKEVLLVPIGVFVIDRSIGGWRWWQPLVVILLVVSYNFSTHYLAQKKLSVNRGNEVNAEYDSGRPAFSIAGHHFTESSYLALKRTALLRVQQHPLFGLGADQFQQRLLGRDRPTAYPAHLPAYNPHSTWFGALAEAGIAGAIAVLYMVVILGKQIGNNLRHSPAASLPLNTVLLGFFSVMAVASLNNDLLHLRYLWVPVAMVVGQVGRNWR